MKKIGIRDVAAHAGVSTATVSHVLNKTRFVSPETIERVLNSVHELNYKPNEMAISFKTGRKNLIGVISPEISNEFHSNIIEAIDSVVNKKGYRLAISVSNESESSELDNLSALSNGVVDAVIITSTLKSYQPIQDCVASRIPVLCLDRTVPDCPFSTITVSNYDAMYQGVTHLINQGHKKIAYIAGIPYLSTTRERLKAYENALMDAHIPVDDSLIHYVSLSSDAANKIMPTIIKVGCTAAAFSNSVLSNDALLYLMEHNMVPGKDFGVLGYNEGRKNDFSLRYMNYITQPVSDIGRIAGEQILELIANPSLPVKQIVLQATFTPQRNF